MLAAWHKEHFSAILPYHTVVVLLDSKESLALNLVDHVLPHLKCGIKAHSLYNTVVLVGMN